VARHGNPGWRLHSGTASAGSRDPQRPAPEPQHRRRAGQHCRRWRTDRQSPV